MYDDEEVVGEEDGFKMDDNELDIPEGIADFGLDEEDPDKDR
ncbi:MAG: hypothetical protein UU13_C0004G0015 [Candidatus Nomurabacteria bacterium GW2011_GWB1_40_7]|uniref:Uncharacterized protein n=1 Tax=Candidatus Nomurabacteria bacterium GW2011_GWB1_40_7 TaxID=1618744 RepID=A0A0G0T0G1_9BACT|nr:MAG: hypothetical protein UU13_C0004G0015 [Candidatus Nomurabacteria bacterium GW2011_GWB1_40_7]